MRSRLVVFREEPADTREAILQATYRALADRGYADLSIQDIGDRFGKSTSLIYHHYDSKEDLIDDLLAFILERLMEQVPVEKHENAYDQLRFSLRYATGDLLIEDQDELIRTLTEFRSQAIHTETFRRRVTEYNRFVTQHFAAIITDGIEDGTFRDVDAHRTAEFLMTAIDGAIIRFTTTNDVDLDAIYSELEAYVDKRLLVDDPT